MKRYQVSSSINGVEITSDDGQSTRFPLNSSGFQSFLSASRIAREEKMRRESIALSRVGAPPEVEHRIPPVLETGDDVGVQTPGLWSSIKDLASEVLNGFRGHSPDQTTETSLPNVQEPVAQRGVEPESPHSGDSGPSGHTSEVNPETTQELDGSQEEVDHVSEERQVRVEVSEFVVNDDGRLVVKFSDGSSIEDSMDSRVGRAFSSLHKQLEVADPGTSFTYEDANQKIRSAATQSISQDPDALIGNLVIAEGVHASRPLMCLQIKDDLVPVQLTGCDLTRALRRLSEGFEVVARVCSDSRGKLHLESTLEAGEWRPAMGQTRRNPKTKDPEIDEPQAAVGGARKEPTSADPNPHEAQKTSIEDPSEMEALSEFTDMDLSGFTDISGAPAEDLKAPPSTDIG